MGRWRELIVLQWSLLLALVVALPWGAPGFLLSHEMVWVPRWELGRDDLWGLAPALATSVPADGVVAVLSSVLDPAFLQRAVLIGSLVLAGVGAARMVGHLGLGARMAAATYAAWNPFVAERFVLGDWPVLVALAALPWIVVALRDPRDVRWIVLTLALAATALSPATGVMGLVTAVVVGVRAGVVRLTVLAALVNAPWIVAGVVHPAAPAASALGPLPEGPLGRPGALLALGGIWTADAVPSSRTTILAAVLVAVLWAAMAVGAVAMWRARRGQLVALTVLGALGLVVAGWSWLAPGSLDEVLARRGEAAVLRDGTRYLALLVPLQAVTLAHGVALLVDRLGDVRWRVLPVGLALVLPIAALPDLAHGVGNRVTPVEYPAGWREARAAVAASTVPGDLVVVPLATHRTPEWNDHRAVRTPATGYFDRTTVVAGEHPRAERIAAVLGSPAATPAQLAAEGIGIVVLEPAAERGDGAVPAALVGARELPLAPGGPRVLEIDGAVEREVPEAERLAVGAAWAVAGLTVAWALLVALGRLVSRLRRGRR